MIWPFSKPTVPTKRPVRCNEAGLQLIRDFEGLRLNPYQDSVGVWTIGYGSTRGVTKDSPPITEEIAERLLIQDVQMVEKDMARLVTRQLNDNQWAAVTSFFFNLGATKIRGTVTLDMLNKGNLHDFANRLLLWNKANGQVLPGLKRRREAERKLFLS